jgi:hypothetical protein
MVNQVVEIKWFYRSTKNSLLKGAKIKKERKMKTSLFLVLFAFLSTLSFAQDATIYNKEWETKGHIQDGKIYDKNWRPQGYIENGKAKKAT